MTRLLTLCAFIAACAPLQRGDSPPLYFPLSMTLLDDKLAVISTNADARFDAGQLLVIDAAGASGQLERRQNADKPASRREVMLQPHLAARTNVPAFADAPLVRDGWLWFTHRADAEIWAVPVQEGTIACTPGKVEQACGPRTRRLQLGEDDPAKLIALTHPSGGHVGVVGSARSDRLQTFHMRSSGELNVWRTYPLTEILAPEERKKEPRKRVRKPVFRIRDLIRVGQGPDGLVAVAVETLAHKGSVRAVYSSYLLLLPTVSLLSGANLNSAHVRVIDLHDLTGARAVRALAASPNGEHLFVAQQRPDVLARIDLARGGKNPLAAVAATLCHHPADVQVAQSGGVYVACYGNDTIQRHDPETLDVRSRARIYKSGVARLLLDPRSDRLYASSLLDDNVMVFRASNLQLLGRIVSQHQVEREGRKR
ncbi:MAG: hypothetical protein AAF471_04120 [Myxococcota bacterium]